MTFTAIATIKYECTRCGSIKYVTTLNHRKGQGQVVAHYVGNKTQIKRHWYEYKTSRDKCGRTQDYNVCNHKHKWRQIK